MRKRLLLLPVLIAMTSGAEPLDPGPERIAEGPKRLRVLTWNTALISTNTVSCRADVMGERLKQTILDLDVDIAGLEEGFNRSAIGRLLGVATNGSHVVEEARRRPERTGTLDVRASGGLALLLRRGIKVAASGEAPWHEASIIDGFAHKGYLFRRVELPGDPPVPVNVFIVHLDAPSASNRQSQLAQLAKQVAEQARPQPIPTVILGDLNISGPCKGCTAVDSEALLARLSVPELGGEPRDVFVEACGDAGERCAFGPTHGTGSDMKRLDYALYYSLDGSASRYRMQYARGTYRVDEMLTQPSFGGLVRPCRSERGPSSDHSAVFAELEISAVQAR